MSQEILSKISDRHIGRISSSQNEPDWLRSYRRNSLALYEHLPVEISPLYNKYTDAKKMNPDMVTLSTSTSKSVPSFLAKRMDELRDQACIVQIGTNIHRINVPDGLASKGVIVSSIFDAIRTHTDLAREALDSSNPEDDKFTALNNAAFDSGMFIHIPPGAAIDVPIHMLVCLPEDGHSAIARNVISAGDDSQATIVQEMYSPPAESQQAYLELLNVRAGCGTRLDVTTLQMMEQTSVNFSTRQTVLAKDASVNWYTGLFGSLLSRYKIDYRLLQPGASVNDSEVVFGNGEQSFDIQTNMSHEGPHTEGRVVEKSILKDRSKSLFKGMIRIKEDASKSNSFLSGRSILLGGDAKSDAIPGLEILTNDVKATHSASVAQIDDEQIFYLQSRCLSREEAERTIVEGFLEPLSRKMSFQVRAWIAYLIESKWDNRELTINTDEELARFIEVEETRYNENSEIEQHYKYR